MIRTLAEVHADRVTVTVTLNTGVDSEKSTMLVPGEQLYTAELVAAPLLAQISELKKERDRGYALADRIGDRLDESKGRIIELGNTLKESRELVSFKDRVVDDLEKENAALRLRVTELEKDRRRSRETLPGCNLYTEEEVAAAQASEAELVAAPLRRQVADLKEGQEADHREIVALRRRCDLLQAEREAAVDQLAQAKRDRDTFKAQAYEQNDRAAQNKEWAERAETRVAQLGVELAETKRGLEAAQRSVLELREVTEFQRGALANRDRDFEVLFASTHQLNQRVKAAEEKAARVFDQETTLITIDRLVSGTVIGEAIRNTWTDASGAGAMKDAIREIRRILASPSPDESQA